MNDKIVAGVDACPGGWVSFQVNTVSRATDVRILNLPALLRVGSSELVAVAIDIPIGLLDGPRACDRAARKVLGPVRGCSVLSSPSRAALSAKNYRQACQANQQRTGRMLSRQSWCIGPKIKEIDEAISPSTQEWVSEVHPEVCFWAMNGKKPMTHRKKRSEGQAERLNLVRRFFPAIEEHTLRRPVHVGIDDLLDAAAGAWTALRIHQGTALSICTPEQDARGLEVTIRY
jgi:predicted RNase H-like nuclease